MQIVGAENHIYMRCRGANGICHAFLLHHASAYTDNQFRIFLFQLFQFTQLTKHLALCFFTNTAGVEQYKICFRFYICFFIAHLREKPEQNLTVSFIHLASKCMRQTFFHFTGLLCVYRIHIVNLIYKICGLFLHNATSFPVY